jgi:hypothetical protein
MNSDPSLRAMISIIVVGGAIGCGNDGGVGAKGSQDGGSGGSGGSGRQETDGGVQPAPPSDPCAPVGYRFDGKSDCSVVRCPKLSSECPAESPTSTTGETLTVTACVPDRGCLVDIDCARACNPAARITREVCQQRIVAAGSQRCREDSDCTVGTCREESVGKICIDALSCSEDGHCGAGFQCRVDPKAVSSTTGALTTAGKCSNRAQGGVCYADAECAFGRCSGGRCNGGLDGESCASASQCKSGLCRKGSTDVGSCASGKPGTNCTEDEHCLAGLHCGAGVCASGDVGQPCETDGECDSGICALSLCRGGEPGSACEDDADCEKGLPVLQRYGLLDDRLRPGGLHRRSQWRYVRCG